MSGKGPNMSKRYLRIGLLTAAAALTIAGTVALASAGDAGADTPQPTVVPPGGSTEPKRPGPVPTRQEQASPYPSGVPAIQPRTGTGDPATPAFTTQDVEAYVKAEPIGPRVSRDSVVTIERIDFLPRRAFPQRYPYLRPLAAEDTLLCVVTLRGNFVAPAPPAIRARDGIKTTDTAYQVFDAHTGNLLTEAVGRGTRTP